MIQEYLVKPAFGFLTSILMLLLDLIDRLNGLGHEDVPKHSNEKGRRAHPSPGGILPIILVPLRILPPLDVNLWILPIEFLTWLEDHIQ